MFGAILKATNSSFQKGITFCRSIYVKKFMKLLSFIFEQPSYQVPSFRLLPSGYLIVSFVHVSVCTSVQLEMHRQENMIKITDVRAHTCTTFHFIFNFYCFFI